jgi:glucosyl-3-phosphoglycerate phosphatase
VRLVLWRHGRTSWNDSGRFQGQADIPLDDVGRRQAAAAAPLLLAMRPSVVVSSDLMRCQATAATLGLPYRSDARLREIDLGAWSGLTSAEAARRFPAEDAAWRRGEDRPRGGGETYRMVGGRAIKVVEELDASGALEPDGLAVVVLHGGSARALMGRLLELPSESWYRLGPLGNCRWSLLSRHEGGFRLLRHNMAADAAGMLDGAVGPRDRATGVPAQPPDSPPSAPDAEPVHLRSGS